MSGSVPGRTGLGILGLICYARIAIAQTSIFYPIPPPGAVRIDSGIPLAGADGVRFTMNVYRSGTSQTAQPALVFFHARVFPGQPRSSFIEAWCRIAAAHGLVALYPEIRGGSEEADLRAVLRYLTEQGSRHGIDSGAIALYAGSGPAAVALPIIQNPALTSLKAAVLYYGGGSQLQSFRPDLPLLLVRAGLDRPSLNAQFDATVRAMLAQNVPVRVLNHAAGLHAFEGRNDDAITRGVIEETIEFVKRVTTPGYQRALRSGVAEASAAAQVAQGNFELASASYARLVQSRPDDATLRLAYGEALLGAKQYAAACAEFDRLKGKGLGARDLAVPAARACALKGDPATALAWLETIPKRFLPPSLSGDSAFFALREDPRFKALFRP